MRRIPFSTLSSAAGRLRVALGFVCALSAATNSFGQSRANSRCVQTGGMLMTNFISQTQTLGTATGDLKGAVAATILSMTPGLDGSTTFRVQHQWTTEAGETLMFEAANAVGVPTETPGVSGVTYEKLNLVGGTGKYDGAHGELHVFGTADLPRGETVFRYEGEVCFRPPAGS